MIEYLYYGWVDYENSRYLVSKYPIIEKQNLLGNDVYVVDVPLYVGDHYSTNHIEKQQLNRDLQFKNGDKVGMMSLDYLKAFKFVTRKKLGRESYLMDELQKIQEAKIEDCGE